MFPRSSVSAAAIIQAPIGSSSWAVNSFATILPIRSWIQQGYQAFLEWRLVGVSSKTGLTSETPAGAGNCFGSFCAARIRASIASTSSRERLGPGLTGRNANASPTYPVGGTGSRAASLVMFLVTVERINHNFCGRGVRHDAVSYWP